MPILAGFLSTCFGSIFAYLAQRTAVGFAAAAAFIITSGAAFVAVKAALAALATGITAVLPPTTYTLLSYCVPGNLGSCITAILIADAVATSWDYWRSTLGISMQLVKG